MDISAVRMRYLHDILGGHVNTLMSNHAAIEEEIAQTDLVIGAVLLPGARTPRLVTRKMVERMKPGAALVDLSSIKAESLKRRAPPRISSRCTSTVMWCTTASPICRPRCRTR